MTKKQKAAAVAATNGLAVATNYVAANMIPEQGLIKLSANNNMENLLELGLLKQIAEA